MLPWDVRREMREGETVPPPGDWLLDGSDAILRNIRPDTCRREERKSSEGPVAMCRCLNKQYV